MKYNIALTTETIEYQNEFYKIKNIHPSNKECTWTERMEETLEQIDTDYIIFMLDDFFLYDFVRSEEVSKCIEYLENNPKIATFTFYPLFMQSIPSKYPGYNMKEKGSKYKVSALIGIWNKRMLQKYICGYKENIWEWEKNATDRSNNIYIKDEFYVMKNNVKEIFPYNISKYGLFSGKWLTPTKELFEKQNIEMDFSKRGFYDEALRGLEKSIISSFEMSSAVMPYYDLTHKGSSYLECRKKFKRGKFKQEYKISGARNIVRWEPSEGWGFGISNLKIEVIYKDKTKELIDLENTFGNFVKEKDIFVFNTISPHMLIPTNKNKIISRLIIEGELVFPLTKETLEKSYNKETTTNSLEYIKLREELWHEFMISKEKMYHVDFYPDAYTLENDETHEKIKNMYKVRKEKFISTLKVKSNYQNITWMASRNTGYAIKGLKILIYKKNGKCEILSKNNIKQEIECKRGRLYFFLGSTLLHLNLDCVDVEKIIIKGKFICPIKSSDLRYILYRKNTRNPIKRFIQKKKIGIELNSAVVPYYELTHRNSSYIKCNKVLTEGKFKQEYNIPGARKIIRWEPSEIYGIGIIDLKIEVIYKDKTRETIENSRIFGNFVKEKNIYVFNSMCPHMLIPTDQNKIISKLIIEGNLILDLTEEMLDRARNRETLTDNPVYIELKEKIWNEFIVSKEKMYHIKFEPLAIDTNTKIDIKNEYKINSVGAFRNILHVETGCKMITWMASRNTGYAIKNLKVLIYTSQNKIRSLKKENIKQEIYCNAKGLDFFLGSTILNFNLSEYDNIDKIMICGKFICPVKSKSIRDIVYGNIKLENLGGVYGKVKGNGSSRYKTRNNKAISSNKIN